MANRSSAPYVAWEEKIVSTEKGRREVHYYLNRTGGGADLVVVGREKCTRHVSYYYAIKDNKALLSSLKRTSILKLRSRREVIDWLDSILTGETTGCTDRNFGDEMVGKLDHKSIEDSQILSLKPEFKWVGSPLACRKRRRHYQSFCRNGVMISVQDFVYVLAEEDKRLVAYLDDMYEDSRGNKMVVVRWFHRIDEVGFVLPRNYNDREIFFSLCLQDLSVECIDGQATVLSPDHYEKFNLKARQMGLFIPFVCSRQFDNDDVQPFDITQIKGYWKQDVFRKMHSSDPSCLLFDEDVKVPLSVDTDVGCRPQKRIRRSNECEIILKPAPKTEPVENLRICCDGSIDSRCGKVNQIVKESCTLSWLDDAMLPKCVPYLTIGSQIEVLSQDSGLSGCWFRAIIIKKHKDKVKVQYQDIKDAEDDSKNLEEWLLASRLATQDSQGIRISGRSIIRPSPASDKGQISCVVFPGSLVDAWWHGGWWEGIVVKSKSADKFHVYFPEEKQEQIFNPVDLRQSREWIDNGWKNIEGRPEVILTWLRQQALVSKNKTVDARQDCGSVNQMDFVAFSDSVDLPPKVLPFNDSKTTSLVKMPKCSDLVRDLLKDDLLAQLRWKSSGKRRRSRSPLHKPHHCYNGSSDSSGMHTFENLVPNPSVKCDQDNCKYAHDPIFSSVVSSISSLVM